MNISAAPWSGSLLIPLPDSFPARLLLAGAFLVLLNSCAGLRGSAPISTGGDYRQRVSAMDNWSLRGRLNIRSSNSSDTVNINWLQQGNYFDINLSGTLGMGAARISGTDDGVLVEKAGEDPVTAPGLDVLGSEILGYYFPANALLYWIRGIPAPGGNPQTTLNADGLTATLTQADAAGRRWQMQYDRYQEVDGIILPGRIRLEQTPYRLTFVIGNWEIPDGENP